MPVLKHAKKKMRQDKKRTQQNKRVKAVYKSLMKKARQTPNKETISKAFSSLDKAAKQNIIHKNKAARLKASLSKLEASGKTAPVATVTKKKTNQKPTTKKTKKKKS